MGYWRLRWSAFVLVVAVVLAGCGFQGWSEEETDDFFEVCLATFDTEDSNGISPEDGCQGEYETVQKWECSPEVAIRYVRLYNSINPATRNSEHWADDPGRAWAEVGEPMNAEANQILDSECVTPTGGFWGD